jgi:sugar/nucleoside kinase (ribokinase family)
MSLLVVGSLALDTVETSEGRAENVFGGSAAYFSYAAGFFTDVRLVGVVGNDFPHEYLEVLKARNIDTSGIERVEQPTFRWHGKYHEDKNVRDTISVHLNCLAEYEPKVPEQFRDTPFVFLANADPGIQMRVLKQMKSPKLVVSDTMNLYIEKRRDALIELLGRVGGFVANDEEIRLLTGSYNLISAGRELLKYGPKFLIIKKGEHGAILFTKDEVLPFPAYPLDEVIDPTGAGDSFGGGMLGFIAETGDFTNTGLKKAVAYGTVTASFTCQDFSLECLKDTQRSDIDKRYRQYVKMLKID